MKTTTIRQQFIAYFESQRHHATPAVPIVQKSDSPLLFVNAGMNPFVPIFLGNESPKHPRVVNSQPCLRVTGKHNDLAEVGIDTYHHTLFEMLGSWSFGDYFKEEAIKHAWTLLTEIYKLPKARLYATVFQGDKKDNLTADSESHALWSQYLPKEHILYASKADNFWEMGTTGPCGPCTEIHIDMRTQADQQAIPASKLVNTGHPQVIEIWNLVFIQYHRQASGELQTLPTPHVDTGMGLERLAMALQGKHSTYDTDAFAPLIQTIAQRAHTTYGKNPKHDIALRVAADHIRAITFAIADGALPSPTQAGYVVRRLIRRALHYGAQHLGLEQPFLHSLIPTLLETMGNAYPQLTKQATMITKVILQEEENFLRTLSQGIRQFEHFRTASPNNILDGKDAFKLYDTYGFPITLTTLMAQEAGITLDMKGFEKEMKTQKTRSKKASTKTYGDWQGRHKDERTTTFLGYDQTESSARVQAYRSFTTQGKTLYHIVLDQTPFYPEGGGQVGDTGYLISGTQRIKVLDTRKEAGVILHYTETLPTDLSAPLQAKIDHEKRVLTTNNHSATHLLDAALCQVLGDHVIQCGSYLDDQRLRFDFRHAKKLTGQEIVAIENLVNQKIRANIQRQEVRQMPLAQAQAQGARTLPTESYAEKVRMITFDPQYSVALCGGTHVAQTGQIGLFKIIAETSVAAGIRRIEAITACATEQWVRTTHKELTTLQDLLKNKQDTAGAAKNLQTTCKKLKKQIADYQAKETTRLLKKIKAHLQHKDDFSLAILEVNTTQVENMRKVINHLSGSQPPPLLILATRIEKRAYLAVMVDKSLTNRYDAQKIVQKLLHHIQGKGGGSPTFALAQGSHTAGIEALINSAKKLFKI